jgi:hypothetical protein
MRDNNEADAGCDTENEDKKETRHSGMNNDEEELWS